MLRHDACKDGLQAWATCLHAHFTAVLLPLPVMLPQQQEPDEMICRAGDYLVVVLTKARRLMWLRRSRRVWQAGLLGVAALAAFRWLRQRAGHRAGGGSGRS